jgi:hypothetical protein
MTATVETNVDEATRALEDAKKRDLELLAQYQDEALKTQMSSMDRELAELADKYKERLELAKKYGQDETQIREAWKIEQQKIIDQYEQEALDREKAAAEERWQKLQNDLDRIREEYEISKLRDVKEPRGEEYETRYKTPVMSFVFGLGKNFEHSYQTKGNIEALYQKELENNDALYKLTTDRIGQEKEMLNNQLTELQNNLDQKLISEQEFADRKREISRKLLEAEQAEKTAFYT